MTAGPIEIQLSSEPETTVSQPSSPPLYALGSGSRGMTFEGVDVARSEVKISGAVAVDMPPGETLSLDDRVRLVGDFRVNRVNHYVDQKSGDVVRQVIVGPCDDLQIVPWDISNPNDNGILRANP